MGNGFDAEGLAALGTSRAFVEFCGILAERGALERRDLELLRHMQLRDLEAAASSLQNEADREAAKRVLAELDADWRAQIKEKPAKSSV